MEIKEFIKKCRTISLEEKGEDKVSFAGKMKAIRAISAGGCFVGKNSNYEGGKQGGLAYGYAASIVDSVRGED